MARKSDILKRHRSTLYLLAACIVVLGLLYFLTIAGDLRSRQALSAHLEDATRRAETQKLLAPLLEELKGESEASAAAVADEKDALLNEAGMSADNYEKIIEEVVRRCGLEQTSLAPDIQSLLSDTGDLRVDMEIRGNFPDLRRLILELARIPFVSGIEKFSIEESADTGVAEMFLQLRLQLAATGEGVHEQP